MQGFLPQVTWQEQRAPMPLLPECDKCKLDKGCITPYMPVSGKGERKVLILAEANGKDEDEIGKHFVGQSGIKLQQMLNRIGVNLRRDCWLDNSVRCRPSRNRTPDKTEISFCRPNLVQALQEYKPNVVIPLGKAALMSILPLAWKDGEADDMARWAGWQIPSQALNCWICPTYHPSFLLQEKQPAPEMIVTRQLKAAFEIEEKPWPNGPPNYKRMCKILQPEDAACWIETFIARGKPVAIDLETTTLKPDGPHAEIICCAISDGRIAIAFPWREAVFEPMRKLLISSLPKIVANLWFETRWFERFLGVWTNWAYDTLLGAHWLNCVGGIVSVKFQAFVLFGIEDYDRFVDKYKKSKDRSGNSPNRLKELPIRVVAEYNALDALFEAMIAFEQAEAGGVRIV